MSTRTSHIGPMTRLQASGTAQRLYPIPVGIAWAKARAEVAWRREPAERESALRSMELLVGRTARADEVERLARTHMYEKRKYQELAWRLPTITSFPVGNLERLRAHARAGTGVILSIVHQGHFAAHGACIARHGVPLTVIVAPRLFGEQPPTFAGLYRRQLFRTFTAEPDVTVLDATNSFAKLSHLLEAGGTVLIACDVQGSTPVQFLGRTVTVSSGTARLSLATGAPILPVSVVRHGHLERLEVQETLPSGHTDHRELLQAVFDAHAPAVLAWPEAVERPPQHFHPIDGD
jgi:lauroyl/myristoyl acyltransferase